MNTLSPVLADAHRLVRQDLYLHLDNAEHLASSYLEWSEEDIDSARALIADLITVVRGVLALHDKADAAQCNTCAMPWPCTVLETVHRLVKNPDAEFVRILKRVNGLD